MVQNDCSILLFSMAPSDSLPISSIASRLGKSAKLPVVEQSFLVGLLGFALKSPNDPAKIASS